MKTLTAEEFKKKYGEQGVAQFKQSSVQPAKQQLIKQQPVRQSKYLSRVTDKVGEDINTRTDRMGAIDARPIEAPTYGNRLSQLERPLQQFGLGAGFAAKTLETTVGEIPGIKQGIEKVGQGIQELSNTAFIKKLGDKIGSNKTLQEVVTLYDEDANFKDTVDAVANTVRLGVDVDAAMSSVNKVASTAKDVYNKVTTPTVKINGKKWTLDEIHKGGDEAIKKMSPKQQEAFSKFDREQSLKLNIKNAKAAGKDTTDLEGMLKASQAEKGATNPARMVARDVVPGLDRVVNHQVTRALDLTAGDVKNISQSTGHEVGQFMAEKNLIGANKDVTVKNLETFFKDNFDSVRNEISKVKNVYKKTSVPRYVEALKELKQKTEGVPGLQKTSVEIDNLLNKPQLTLNDVQRVKELMDDHFNLYTVTGDVGQGVAKEGMSNIRSDLKTFIENEVKKNTGADIKELNNNVSTSKGILDAVDARSTAGLTRSNLKIGDLGVFGIGLGTGGPLMGMAFLFGKKILESPAVQLRIAKYLDGISDSRKAKIRSELESGKVPEELNNLIKKK